MSIEIVYVGYDSHLKRYHRGKDGTMTDMERDARQYELDDMREAFARETDFVEADGGMVSAADMRAHGERMAYARLDYTDFQDYGGAFDGHTVTSDADGGL